MSEPVDVEGIRNRRDELRAYLAHDCYNSVEEAWLGAIAADIDALLAEVRRAHGFIGDLGMWIIYPLWSEADDKRRGELIERSDRAIRPIPILRELSDLRTEVRRLKANPGCPACGHPVTGHEVTTEPYEQHYPDRWIGCAFEGCPCEDWRMP